MKKIGLLYGMENLFPETLMEKINSMKLFNISAELMKIGSVRMDEIFDYNVILDRVSFEVPFYRSVLKNAILKGIHVFNNPFWCSADDNFFHASLGNKIGIKTPRTVVLPSKELPRGTTPETLRNLIYPLSWEKLFSYVGFPAFLKPNIYTRDHNEFKVYNPTEFFSAYDLTGSQTMLLQESIEYDKYYRCYVIGKKAVRIMNYDPSKPLHLRYSPGDAIIEKKIAKEIEKISLKICIALGFDMNAIEFAIKDNELYTIDFFQPAPLAKKSYLHADNFNWLVEATADFLIRVAKDGKYYTSDFSWSAFLKGPKSPTRKSSRNKRGRPASNNNY